MSVAVDLEQGLRERLKSDAGVAALVALRIYPDLLPQAVTYPAIRYQRITTERPSAMHGDAGVAAVQMQVDTFAVSAADARQLATAIRAALQRWRGVQVVPTVGSIEILDSFVSNELAEYEQGTPAGIYRVMQEYRIWHREV